jgi:ribosomal protein S18 acetylase RimI-like enzyme
MTSDDVLDVARIHATTLLDPWGRMGARFLRIFYEELARREEIGIVATSRGVLIGFAAGTIRPGHFFATLLRRRLVPLGISAIPALIRHPTMVPRFAHGLLKPADARRSKGTATLLFIAVCSDTQHRGIGRSLVDAFTREAAARSASRIDLQTDRLRNEAANAFYRKLGFRLTGTLSAGRRLINSYELDLRAQQGTASVGHDVVSNTAAHDVDQA